MTGDASSIRCDSPQFPTLVVIRGNSGSGKTTTAREVRRRFGRGAALLELDQVRREILREHGSGRMGPVTPGFITGMARMALEAGYHVVLEGILPESQYGAPLRKLIADHPGSTACFYMAVSFDERVRRHLLREEPIPVSAETMREWYLERDLLDVLGEHVIPEATAFEEVVTTILHGSGLNQAAALTPCPTRCPRCAEKAEDASTGSPAPPRSSR
jgi:predicted kinase